MTGSATIVLDIGKTNVKLALIDADGRTLAEQRSPNAIVAGACIRTTTRNESGTGCWAPCAASRRWRRSAPSCR